MVSTFINPLLNPDASLGVGTFNDTAPICLWENHSDAEVDVVIRAAYRQILGNAHVMESERLIVSESQLRQGDISVRGFVRQVAQSALYRALFFEACSRSRSIELNFKHLLGRAPESHEEVAQHGQWLDQGGFEAEIDSYIDSDEYQAAFGEHTVPYYRGYKTQTGKKMVGFTHMFQLLRGSVSSDKDLTHQNRSRLNASLMTNRPSAIAPVEGAPSSWQYPAAGTDVSAILAAVFKPKHPASQTQAWATAPNYAAEAALRQTIQEQAQVIDRLQQQLTTLRPFAAIGSAYLKSDWQSTVASPPEKIAAQLQQQADAQTTQIAALQAQIANAQPYAAIGEARLNKWRSRTFNS
ncbi:MAG: phycobilisome rod-core linker polypeptide [Stenomitos rutilans HA7619-LM2]|nr:phycobilisome rod-core linker polypeptide [Stenomitos rutilans HA7619-LM2]